MDPFYNADAARWAREAVMKMDDDTARVFVTAATHSILMQDIANNRRTLNGHIMEIQKSLYEDAQRIVSKNAVLTPVQVIEDISKAFGGDEFTRDERGRFSTQESRIRTNRARRPYDRRQEQAEGIPSAKKVAAASSGPGRPVKGRKLTPAERAAYQQQYVQLVELMDRYASQGVKNPEMVLEDKTTGRRRAVPVNFQGDIPVGWNPARQNIVAVRASELNTAGGATFDLVSALGAQRTGGVAADAVEGVQSGNSAFQERWHSEGTSGTNERTYNRIQAGSQLLGQVAPNSPKAQVASKFGEFVGQFGPEAEKVVGPHLRKTTYRYRGTEKKPDSKLIQERNIRVQRLEVPESDQSVAQIAARRAGVGSSVSAEQKAMASVQTATGYLMDRVPSIRLSEIQRKSGKIPPSEGVIIDADGKIATQAVGYADDHYLPFNLKNLKGLQGGSYVRTRTKGGLTTEDIYTGLVSGARQVTVVSNSGVFTIEFEDDFRGVRRYNDKAASMVDRYAKTLDAIQGGQIEREPIDPMIKAEIREQVEQEMPRAMGYTSADIEAQIKERTNEYRSTPQLSTREIEHIESEAKRLGKNEGDVRRLRSQLMDAELEKKADRMYKLDGQGYAAAIESLREQYPYYIKSVSFMNKREAMDADGNRTDPKNAPESLSRFSGGSDQGYVKPRHNRPTEAQAGYYDESINGRGKQSAANTNYQNWGQNPNRGKLVRVEEGSESAQSSSGKKTPVADRAHKAEAEFKLKRAHKETLKGMTDHLSDVTVGASYPLTKKAREDFESVYNSNDLPAYEAEVDRLWNDMKTRADSEPEVKTLVQSGGAKYEALQTERGRTGGDPWNAEAHLGKVAKQPYSFKGEAYEPGAKGIEVKKEVMRLAKELDKAGMGPAATVDDTHLRDAAASAGAMAQIVRSDDGERASRTLAALAAQINAPEGWTARQMTRLEQVKDPEAEAAGWAQAAENMQRLRRLMANGVPAEGGATVRPAESNNDGKTIPVHDGNTKKITQTRVEPEEAQRLLDNLANTAGDDYIASDYREVGILYQRGQYHEARALARSLNETDRVRRATLKSVFPDLD